MTTLQKLKQDHEFFFKNKASHAPEYYNVRQVNGVKYLAVTQCEQYPIDDKKGYASRVWVETYDKEVWFLKRLSPVKTFYGTTLAEARKKAVDFMESLKEQD